MNSFLLKIYKYVPDIIRRGLNLIICTIAMLAVSDVIYQAILEFVYNPMDAITLEKRIFLMVECIVVATLFEIKVIGTAARVQSREAHKCGAYNGFMAGIIMIIIINGSILTDIVTSVIVGAIFAAVGSFAIINDLNRDVPRRKKGIFGKDVYIMDIDSFRKLGGQVLDSKLGKRRLDRTVYMYKIQYKGKELVTEVDEYSHGIMLIPEMTGESSKFWRSFEDSMIDRMDDLEIFGSGTMFFFRIVYAVVSAAYLLYIPAKAISLMVVNYMIGDQLKILQSAMFTGFSIIIFIILKLMRPYMFVLGSMEKRN